MPVNLLSLPEKIAYPATPSIKTWGAIFLFITACFIIVNYTLLPEMQREPLPKTHMISFILITWFSLYVLRWLMYILYYSAVLNFNNQRQREEDRLIEQGQRAAYLVAQSMFLPHVIHCQHIANLIISNQPRLLPRHIVDNDVSYYAQFIDTEEDTIKRLKNQLSQLLLDRVLLSSLNNLPKRARLAIALSIEDALPASQSIKQALHSQITEKLGHTLNISALPNFSFFELDRWLDQPSLYDFVLFIGISHMNSPQDNHTEVAIAQLFSAKQHENMTVLAQIHRPETITDEQPINWGNAIESALIWGKVEKNTLKNIFVTTHQGSSKLDNVKEKTLTVGGTEKSTLHDISTCIGYTSTLSSWVNIYLAAAYLATMSEPLLLIDNKAQDSHVLAVTPV